MRKPLLCWLGIHRPFRDHVGRNVGTEDVPIYIFETYWQCNYCPARELE